MPRKGQVRRRITPPDSVYANASIAKFVNCLMLDGKKSTAERIMYGALDVVAQRLGIEPVEVYEKAMNNVRPQVEVRPRRVGGATYQVPVEVLPDRAQALAIRWIIQYSRSRKGIPMMERLARELADACKGEGGSVKKREDTHRMAEANRAFAHYRW
ncbi:30S ribosomal protein S7 [Synergistales bacterium]|nr:30S ribosomal protein S7 [Synergistales bacterium]GHV55734.1 30S ribosomal protein S7 [Synergistales bacterium]